MRGWVAAAFVAVVGLAVSGPAARGQEATLPDLVVHEWGTFTSVVGASGVALDWRPLSAASDLPSFVYTLRGLADAPVISGGATAGGAGRPPAAPSAAPEPAPVKKRLRRRVRMETPVLYFYTPRACTLDVAVGFPEGRITEWYPQAAVDGAGITWRGVRVDPQGPTRFPQEPEPSHYYPARAVDAAPLTVNGADGSQHDRLLFYRGVGTFALPLAVRPDGDRLHLTPTDGAVPLAIYFERVGDRVAFRVVSDLRVSAPVRRPDLDDVPDDGGDALARCQRRLRQALIAAGLYAREADAMLDTWDDTWFEPGTRVLYLVPPAVTDRILPLQITPRPAHVTRVLVGRIEVLTAERRAALRAAVRALGSDDWSARQAAQARLAREGPFAEPVLRALLAESDDPEMSRRIRQLLDE